MLGGRGWISARRVDAHAGTHHADEGNGIGHVASGRVEILPYEEIEHEQRLNGSTSQLVLQLIRCEDPHGY